MDKEPKVTGIGGVFFKTANASKTKDWYRDNLGIKVNEWGASFEFRNANRPEEINYLSWSPFSADTDYFNPSDQSFMINYRVQNLDGLLQQFKSKGIELLGPVQEFEYGRFAHILDPNGIKIELWEPIDEVFTKMGGETNK